MHFGYFFTTHLADQLLHLPSLLLTCRALSALHCEHDQLSMSSLESPWQLLVHCLSIYLFTMWFFSPTWTGTCERLWHRRSAKAQSDNAAFDGGCQTKLKRLVVVLIDALRDDFTDLTKLSKHGFRYARLVTSRRKGKQKEQTNGSSNKSLACYAKYNDKETCGQPIVSFQQILQP